MDEETLDDLARWFSDYVHTFKSGDPGEDENIILKEEHTARVRREISDIGRTLGLADDDLRLAEAMALFHDLGRFPQYATYGTFSDRRSCDHAALSVGVLIDSGVLDALDPEERELILKAISRHNRAGLPEEESDRCLLFSKLLRDADKLDIWAVLLDYYQRREKEGYRNAALELDLPDAPGISEEVRRDIMAGEIVKLSGVKRLNDFKLLQASWVFDINYRPALLAVRKRGYLEEARKFLPRTEEVDMIFTLLKSSLDWRIESEVVGAGDGA
ncbi:HD domain-containing protein [Methanothrix harundinacea]|uniref:Metal-dependent phosphohydrolase, HD subdomain protein n=1 Tax=Methanothrix harundinacea (strain 6Ac) TaxID=1110509 RepID=G7WN35_METH6|nr:HD domain-containing protein [Methanothrix harundinacea]AET63891.1 Metal-dependent phosphohydrolase, HD subdomain protein [Methanothrix harundinacea 6Ac]